jgi:predicted MFS family arabinose efflux permease
VNRSWLRWPLLFFFVNCSSLVSALALCFSPASGYIAPAYNVHLLEVAACGISYTATYIPATLASVYLYSKMKSHNVTRIACFIFFTGAWMRTYCVFNNKFWPILAGEIWISLSCPLFFNMMTQFCADWFPNKERTFVTALCGLTIPLGNLLAFIMSGLMFKGIDTPDLETRRDMV